MTTKQTAVDQTSTGDGRRTDTGMPQVRETERGNCVSSAISAEAPAPARRKKSLYENVLVQFNKAADLMHLDSNIRKILAATENEIVSHFPVKMNSGHGVPCAT